VGSCLSAPPSHTTALAPLPFTCTQGRLCLCKFRLCRQLLAKAHKHGKRSHPYLAPLVRARATPYPSPAPHPLPSVMVTPSQSTCTFAELFPPPPPKQTLLLASSSTPICPPSSFLPFHHLLRRPLPPYQTLNPHQHANPTCPPVL